MIPVTKTFLPPPEEYQRIINRAWETGWMTNRGVLVKELENQLKNYLGVSNIIAMTNGTLPIQIAIKALQLKGEIITTPFSYVATTASIVWENCTPVFVDIDPEYLTIDETKIEAAITPKTTAILATHVFGNPCNVEALEILSQKHGLKVIYDAAHCFGVKYKGQSIFNYGDISTCSFHATKLFHTGEGGALFCRDKTLFETCYYMHNFGHQGTEAFQGLGINAKMSEPQAAMGLAVLPYLSEIIQERRRVTEQYDAQLDFSRLKKMTLRPGTQWNYSYYPVLFETEEQMLVVQQALNQQQIFPRRYFYPALNSLPYVTPQPCPIAESVSSRILCLPMYVGLNSSNIQEISTIISSHS